jgi:hypothetical protein
MRKMLTIAAALVLYRDKPAVVGLVDAFHETWPCP